jgi:hypothetical protein
MPIFTATGHLAHQRIHEDIKASCNLLISRLQVQRDYANHLQLHSFRWALINFTSAKTSSTTLTVQTAEERELQIGADLFALWLRAAGKMCCETLVPPALLIYQQLHAKFQNQLALSICIEKMHCGEWASECFSHAACRAAVCWAALHAKKQKARRLATTLTIHAHFLHNCSGRVRTTCCASRSPS